MNEAHIYTLADPETGEVRYVGKSINLHGRFYGHLSQCWREETHKGRWLKSLRFRGLRPRMELLESVPESEWQATERFWIESLRFMGCRLTNADLGGDGGNRHSEETKAKIGAAHKGRKKSPQHIANLRLAWFGDRRIADRRKALSPQQQEGLRQKLKEAWKRRRLRGISAETRRKMSEAHLRRNYGKN